MRYAQMLMLLALAGCDAFAPDVDFLTLSGTYEGESSLSYVRGIPMRLEIDSTVAGRMYGSVKIGVLAPFALEDAAIDGAGALTFAVSVQESGNTARWVFTGAASRKGNRIEGELSVATSDGDSRGNWLVRRE